MKFLVDHAFSGLEFTWFAVDSTGHIACFCSAGCGPVPEVAITNSELLESAEDIIDGLPCVGSAHNPTPPRGNPYHADRLAERGFYAFDWRAETEAYVIESKPTNPIRVADIASPDVQKAVGLLGLSLELTEIIQLSRAELLAALAPSSNASED